MDNTRYKKTRLARHIWLGLAIFFLVFNSTPVKKFIRICLAAPSSSIAMGLTDAPQFSTTNAKDCTLIERHTVSTGSIMQEMVQQSGEGDAVTLFFLSALIPAALLYFFKTNERPFAFLADAPEPDTQMPVYLQIHKLQV